jgi:hypothetical protein
MENQINWADDIIWRKVEDEIAVLKDDGCSLHILNETAAHIWEMCNGNYEPDEIAASLCEHFDVTVEEAKADVLETLGNMENLGILKWDREGGKP